MTRITTALALIAATTAAPALAGAGFHDTIVAPNAKAEALSTRSTPTDFVEVEGSSFPRLVPVDQTDFSAEAQNLPRFVPGTNI